MALFININDDSFTREVLNSEIPVIVEFTAEWCGPCKQLEPILIELFQDSKKEIRLARIDIDNCIQTTQQYQVMSIPTLILFVNGEARQRVKGKQPADKIMEKFSPFLEEKTL